MNHIFSSQLFSITVLCLATGCSGKTEQHYTKDGLEFSCPRDWKVTEFGKTENLRYVTIEGKHAIVSIEVVKLSSAEGARGIEEFAKQMATEGSLGVGNVGKSSLGPVEKSGIYDTLRETFMVSASNLNMPFTRIHRRGVFGSAVCFLFVQSADEDWDKVNSGFDQIFTTFRYQEP